MGGEIDIFRVFIIFWVFVIFWVFIIFWVFENGEEIEAR
jgi:hypothetical protein